MTNELNVMELLEQAYIKCFEGAKNNRWNDMTMKKSGLKFRVREGGKHTNATYKWTVEFNQSIVFDYGNWRTFYFDSDIELGKFLFECGANDGMPKKAKGVNERIYF